LKLQIKQRRKLKCFQSSNVKLIGLSKSTRSKFMLVEGVFLSTLVKRIPSIQALPDPCNNNPKDIISLLSGTSRTIEYIFQLFVPTIGRSLILSNCNMSSDLLSILIHNPTVS